MVEFVHISRVFELVLKRWALQIIIGEREGGCGKLICEILSAQGGVALHVIIVLQCSELKTSWRNIFYDEGARLHYIVIWKKTHT